MHQQEGINEQNLFHSVHIWEEGNERHCKKGHKQKREGIILNNSPSIYMSQKWKATVKTICKPFDNYLNEKIFVVVYLVQQDLILKNCSFVMV